MKSGSLKVFSFLFLFTSILYFSMEAHAQEKGPHAPAICEGGCVCVGVTCIPPELFQAFENQGGAPDDLTRFLVGENLMCFPAITAEVCPEKVNDVGDNDGQGLFLDEIPDEDGDTICDFCDNCVGVSNGFVPGVEIRGSEKVPNYFNFSVELSGLGQSDIDNDGHGDLCDNCPTTHNPDQDALACAPCPEGSALQFDSDPNSLAAGCTLQKIPTMDLSWMLALGILGLSLLWRHYRPILQKKKSRRWTQGILVIALALGLGFFPKLGHAQEEKEKIRVIEGCCFIYQTLCARAFDESPQRITFGSGILPEGLVLLEEKSCVIATLILLCPEGVISGTGLTVDELVVDSDGDFICDFSDRCPMTPDGPDPADLDVVDPKDDNDVIKFVTLPGFGGMDPFDFGQGDTDLDGVGDACDSCPIDHNPENDPNDCAACQVAEETGGGTEAEPTQELFLTGNCIASLNPNVTPGRKLFLPIFLCLALLLFLTRWSLRPIRTSRNKSIKRG